MDVKLGQIWKVNSESDIYVFPANSCAVILAGEKGKDDDDFFWDVAVSCCSLVNPNRSLENNEYFGAGIQKLTSEEITRNAKYAGSVFEIVKELE